MRQKNSENCLRSRARSLLHKGYRPALPVFFTVLSITLILLATQGLAQQLGKEKMEHVDAHAGKSVDEIAKELTNPNNSIAKLTFKNQYRWYDGDLLDADQQDNYSLLFQPVFPFRLPSPENHKNVLFVRPAFPVVFDQPVPTVDANGFGFDEVSAMGDIVMDVAYGRTYGSGWLWALGMVSTFPTATDSDVAGRQFRAGPEALFAKTSEWGLLGVFPSHQWDVTGWDDPSRPYSTSSLQLFAIHTAGGGWTYGTQPILTYDWESEEWTVPVEIYVSKTALLGGRPWKFELQVDYYLDKPDSFGPEWLVSFNITPIVHNFIEKWINEIF